MERINQRKIGTQRRLEESTRSPSKFNKRYSKQNTEITQEDKCEHASNMDSPVRNSGSA